MPAPARGDLLDEGVDRYNAGEFERLPKKEASHLEDEIARLNRLLGGVKGARRLPDAVFIVDPHKERLAVAAADREAHEDREVLHPAVPLVELHLRQPDAAARAPRHRVVALVDPAPSMALGEEPLHGLARRSPLHLRGDRAEPEVERLGPDALIAIPPTEAKTIDDFRNYYRALARVSKRPIFVQTSGGAKGIAPDIDTLVGSARAYVNALNKLMLKREKTAPAAALSA